MNCAWCNWLPEDPRFPDCDCRELCEVAQCLPNFPAADVTPGMAIHHPHGCSGIDNGPGSGALDIISVTGPDADGWMHLTSFCETVRVAADWRVSLYTREDAELTEALLMAEQDRLNGRWSS